MIEELAINGGEPVRESYLPYGKQWIDDEDIEAIVKVLRSDYLTTGPVIHQFERKVADHVDAKYAVAFSSGTAALHAACYVAGIKKEDEVITTSMTFAASANCILYLEGRPIFADIEPDTYNISPQSIRELITDRTKAIIPVDFTGQPASYDEIQSIANEYDLVIIEDAAHAISARYKGNKVGSICDMTMFSFHPVKHITTGEGGVITTNNKQYYEELLRFRNHGITRDPKRLKDPQGPWYYEMQSLGFNYRMTDLQAALGVSQLKKINSFTERRKKYVGMYNKELQDTKAITLPSLGEGCDSSWHLYIIRLNLKELKTSRKEFFEALQKENIGVNVHYIPVHLHPYYQQMGYKKGICPNAENLYKEAITLPLFPAMSETDVQDVIKGVKKVIYHYLSS